MMRAAASGKFVILIFSLAISLALVIVGTTFRFTNAYADSDWSPASILKVLKQGTGQVVIAHRGVYQKGCPENSICAIERAFQSNIEGIELDIKQSEEGTPWLFHEQNIGRLVSHDPPFDPFQDANPPAGWDPDLRTITDKQLNDFYLRDIDLAPTTYHPLSLAQALESIKARGWDHMVLVLDIKTLDAVSQAADLAIKYGLQDAVVLKFSSSLLADNSGAFFSLNDTTKGLSFVPTVYAPDMENIMRAGWKYADCGDLSALETNQCTIENWILDLQDQPGYAWLEVGNKMPVNSDPTYFLTQSKNIGSIGGFRPVPEYPDRGGPRRSYVRSNGTCCASLDDYLTPANKWFPAEKQDGRQDINNFWNKGFSSVITDEPTGAIQAATKRNTNLYR